MSIRFTRIQLAARTDTVDGKGEFYILRDMATKIITDAEKVMTNEVIDSEAHS